MAAKTIRMEQLKQVLQLKQDGFSIKAIARTTGFARRLSGVHRYIGLYQKLSLNTSKISALKYFNFSAGF